MYAEGGRALYEPWALTISASPAEMAKSLRDEANRPITDGEAAKCSTGSIANGSWASKRIEQGIISASALANGPKFGWW